MCIDELSLLVRLEKHTNLMDGGIIRAVYRCVDKQHASFLRPLLRKGG